MQVLGQAEANEGTRFLWEISACLREYSLRSGREVYPQHHRVCKAFPRCAWLCPRGQMGSTTGSRCSAPVNDRASSSRRSVGRSRARPHLELAHPLVALLRTPVDRHAGVVRSRQACR